MVLEADQKSSLLTLIIEALIVFVLFDSSQVTTIE